MKLGKKKGANPMEPIIEVNWVSIMMMLGILAIGAGVLLLLIKGAVAIAKKQWREEK